MEILARDRLLEVGEIMARFGVSLATAKRDRAAIKRQLRRGKVIHS